MGDIVPQLINRLRLALYDAEKKRIANMPMTGGANAMELVLRAEALEDRDPSLGSARAARKLYEEALRQDPGSAPALSGLYFTLRTQLDENSSVDRVRLIKEMNDVSVRAVRADREDPRVWLLRSDALGWQHQWDGALAANAEALRIDPYRNGALLNRVELLIETGRADEVFPIIAQGMALDPRSPAVPGFLYRECRAHLFLGHYDAAIASCEKGIGLDTDYWLFAHVLLIAAYAQTGENAKAAAARAGLLERKAWISISSLKARRESDIPTYMQQQEVHLYPGLRKAGIPEQ